MRKHLKLVALAVVLLITSVGGAAQSTNSSSPTPVNGQYKGKGPSSETNYYFSLSGGPGAVSVKLDIKAKDYSTFARIEIGNDPSNLIAMHNMNASTTTGASSVTKEFKLSKKQTVRIKLTLDQNLKEYTLTISGAAGGSSEGPGSTQASDAGTGGKKTGKLGQLTTGSGGKLSATGSQGGKLSPSGAQGGKKADSSDGKQSPNFSPPTCPTDIMYKIVPTGSWNAGLSAQKRYLFQEAAVAGKYLSCTYTQTGTSGDTATIMAEIPVGISCKVYKAGSKSRDFVCGDGIAPQ